MASLPNVMFTMLVLYISFGMLCVTSWGDEIKTAFVTDMLPKCQFIFDIVILSICFSLVFSYSLSFHPALQVMDNLTGNSNIARILSVLLTFVVMLSLGNKLDKFIAIIGALTCTPIAFTIPSIVYYKICARSGHDRFLSITLFLISLLIMTFCTS